MLKYTFGALLLSALMLLTTCNPDDVLGFGPDGDPPVLGPDGEFSPCGEGERIHRDSLPPAILDYLGQNFPGYRFELIRQFSDTSGVRFGIEIEYQDGHIGFYFDEDGSLISFGDSQPSRDVEIDSLPPAILDYIQANYPDNPIAEAEVDWEFGMNFFEVALEDETELYFSEDGSFLCVDQDGDDDGNDDDGDDDDDDDDDDDGPNGPLASIYTFLEMNYPNYEVDGISPRRLCDGTMAFRVELEGEEGDDDDDNLSLFFDMDGQFLFSSREIPVQDLPQAVRDAAASEFPAYQIHGNDVKELLFEDGSRQYQLELERDGGDDDEIRAIFSEDGTLICSSED